LDYVGQKQFVELFERFPTFRELGGNYFDERDRQTTEK